MFDVFTIVFLILILIGTGLLLGRWNSQEDQTGASLGLALGFGFGGAVGLTMSRLAGSFVLILPVSLGLGLLIGWSVGWIADSLQSRN